MKREYTLRTKEEIQAERRQKATEKAYDSLIDFIRFMNPDIEDPDDVRKSSYIVKPHHRYLAWTLERMEDGTNLMTAGSAPPQHGKSMIISEFGTAWIMGRNPKSAMISCTYNQVKASDNGSKVRAIMEDPRYKEVFPDVFLTKKSSTLLSTNHGGKILFTSVNGSGTGFACDFFIIDDPYAGIEDSTSEKKMKKVVNYYNGVVSARCKDYTALYVFHTRWSHGDLQGYLTDPTHPENAGNEEKIQDCKEWYCFNIPVIVEDDNMSKMLGIPIGETIWPERFGLKKMLAKKRKIPLYFGAMYMGRPTPDNGDVIQKDFLRSISYKDFPPLENMTIYAGLDIAVTEKQRSDYSVLVIVGVDHRGICYLLDMVRIKQLPDKMVNMMLNALDKWKPRFVYTEKGLIIGSLYSTFRRFMQERGSFHTIQTKHRAGDKVMKAQPLIALLASGRFVIPNDKPWSQAILQEFLQFPRGTNDDIVDACGEVAHHVHQLHSGTQIVEEDDFDEIEYIKKKSNFQIKLRDFKKPKKNLRQGLRTG